jgi:hypothetical protein
VGTQPKQCILKDLGPRVLKATVVATVTMEHKQSKPNAEQGSPNKSEPQ